MYRKEIKVLDCTIRDGGLINKWQFPDVMVRKVFLACRDSGVDYMEMGYRASKKQFPPGEFGAWRFTTDDDVRRIVGNEKSDMKLGVMVDVGRVEPEDIAPKSESPLSFIRVAAYVKDVDKAIAMANEFHALGYETFINIMAISTATNYELEEALTQIEAETKVLAVSVVDSYGSLFSENVHHLVDMFKSRLLTKEVGFHAHNNQQLAFANTIEAIRKGANFLDVTVNGIGRGPGNCPLELILGFLKNPKFRLEPVLKVIEEVFVPLREEIEWGYIIPYMITGILNEHPRTAIELREDPVNKDHYAEFYRKLTTPEPLHNQ